MEISDHDAYVAFNLTEQVGSVKVDELVQRYGSVVTAWAAYPSKLSRCGGTVDWQAEEARARAYGVAILTPADPDYPESLRIQSSHPLALYVKGSVAALSKPSLAIVGTRRATPYGLDQAASIARDLAERGWCIVSGLAVGIDAEAHRGALAAEGGLTVGVLGSGLDVFYPKENRELAREIVAKGGAVISEFPFGRKPDTQTFPQRNHIVASLTQGVIAVECPLKSGTLITTGFALELGRTVMAVPGRVDSRFSAGCLRLIRDGARLVRHARDVEEEMSELLPRVRADSTRRRESKPKVTAPKPPPYTKEEALVIRHVNNEGVPMEALIELTGLSAERINAVCMMLRLKERVRFFPGNRVALPRDP